MVLLLVGGCSSSSSVPTTDDVQETSVPDTGNGGDGTSENPPGNIADGGDTPNEEEGSANNPDSHPSDIPGQSTNTLVLRMEAYLQDEEEFIQNVGVSITGDEPFQTMNEFIILGDTTTCFTVGLDFNDAVYIFYGETEATTVSLDDTNPLKTATLAVAEQLTFLSANLITASTQSGENIDLFYDNRRTTYQATALFEDTICLYGMGETVKFSFISGELTVGGKVSVE